MARRIALTMLSLVGALLLGAVVPLGLITTARERASFRQDTVLTARALAAIAEDASPNRATARPLAAFFARASKSGEAGWVYDAAGRLIAHTTGAALPGQPGLPAGPAAPVAATMRAVQRGGGISIVQPPSRLQVAAAVDDGGAGGRPAGVVVLARSTAELTSGSGCCGRCSPRLRPAAWSPGRSPRCGSGAGQDGRCRRLTRPPSGWAAARSTPGRPPGRVHPRYAAWPARSTPWPDGWRPWCTATGP